MLSLYKSKHGIVFDRKLFMASMGKRLRSFYEKNPKKWRLLDPHNKSGILDANLCLKCTGKDFTKCHYPYTEEAQLIDLTIFELDHL